MVIRFNCLHVFGATRKNWTEKPSRQRYRRLPRMATYEKLDTEYKTEAAASVACDGRAMNNSEHKTKKWNKRNKRMKRFGIEGTHV